MAYKGGRHPSPKYDLTGKIFDHYMVQKFSGRNDRAQSLWECLCSCGNTRTVVGASLISGLSKSCGCRRYNKHEAKSYYRVHYVYKKGAVERGYEFSLTPEEFLSLVTKNCFYCDKEPSAKSPYKGSTVLYNGIDRVDNDKGYITGNVVTCCKECNTKKKSVTVGIIEKAYEFLFPNKAKREAS